MLATQKLGAFIATTSTAAARRFYGETLGLAIVSQDDFALVVDAHGVSLRIQKVDAFTPQPFTVLGWHVKGIDAVVDALTKRGVAFTRYEGMGQDARGIWTAPGGSRVAWFKDPDGNTLSLSE